MLFPINRYLMMLIMAIPALSYAQVQTVTDLESEIRRVRQELVKIQEERERTNAEKEKDIKDFDDYRKRTAKRTREIRLETDSVRQQIAIQTQTNDSLGAISVREKSTIRQYEILQDEARSDIINAIDSLVPLARALPPSIAARLSASLDLLRNELATKNVHAVEGVSRLFQILRDFHESGIAIQIIQGTSPIADIRGVTYRIRLGFIYEAVVNIAGDKAATWTGYDADGNPLWSMVDDNATAAQILKGINIREGKSLPALVSFPMNTTPVAAQKEAGNE